MEWVGRLRKVDRLEWFYYMGLEIPASSISWEYSEDTPFIRGVRNTQVNVLSETWRSSVVVVLYRFWLHRA